MSAEDPGHVGLALRLRVTQCGDAVVVPDRRVRLLKDAPPEELFRAVRGAARGETVLAPAVAAKLVRRASSPGPVLTDREVEILELLAEGLPNKELAKRLYVSEATVKSHLAHIYTKLGVDSRTAAVTKAIEQRVIRR